MRVALVGEYPLPGRAISGGVERVMDTLARELSAFIDVTLVIPNADSTARQRLGRVEVVYLRRPRLPGLLRYWTVEADAIRRVVRDIKADLVHIHGLAGWGLRLPTPAVVTVHGIPQNEVLFSRGNMLQAGKVAAVAAIERLARRRCNNLIVINDYVLEALPDVAALPHETIENPLDSRYISTPPCAAASAGLRLLSVGTICSRKNTLGVLRLFSAFAALEPEATLAVCGATRADELDYWNACRHFIAANGLTGRVSVLDNKTTEDLIREYDASSCLLLLPHQETAPMVVAEAHARGLFVAAPPRFGLKTMIRPGFNGIHLMGRDETEWAQELQAALRCPAERRPIAADAALRYDPARIASRTLAFYERVLARARRAG